MCVCTFGCRPVAAVATTVKLSQATTTLPRQHPTYDGHSQISHANLPKFSETVCTFGKFVVYGKVAESFIVASVWRLRTVYLTNNASRDCVLLRYDVHLSSPEENAVYDEALLGNWKWQIYENCLHIPVFFRKNLR